MHTTLHTPTAIGNVPRVENWLNRSGLSLQFVALFLVTPEIVGTERLASFTNEVWANPMKSLIAFHERRGFWYKQFWSVLSTVILVVLALVGYLAFANSWAWWKVALTFVVVTFIFTGGTIFVGFIFKKLVNAKRSYLPFGALLFTLGFILLMWATFVTD
jgi:hypothetical protein